MLHLDPSLLATYATIARHVAAYGFSMVTVAMVAHVHQLLRNGLFPQTIAEQHIAALLRIHLKKKLAATPEDITTK